MWTMPNTGETGKSVETLRFAEMLSSFAQIPEMLIALHGDSVLYFLRKRGDGCS